jgi:hypothetical protein
MGIDGAEVRSARGTTTIPITWQPLTAGPGSEKSRQIWGIAYNGALQRERTRITCSEEDWNNPDNRVFYSDESVCMTVDQLRSLKLAGTPMRVQHKTDLPPVGEILDNWVDKEGRLWIHAEVPADTPYQTEMIKLIDNGHCSDLSISYGVERDPDTGEVFQLPVDEISFVTEGHFRGCRVGVKASNAKNDMIPTAKTTFRFVNASFGSRMSTQTPTGTTTTGGANSSQQPDLNDLMDRAAKNTKERVDALKELEETRKRLKETEDRLKAKEDEEKAKKEAEDKAREEARRKYAEQHRPDAEEVIKHLTDVLKAENVPLSEEWKQLELDILTNPEPMARENTAVTIACSKKIKCQSQTIGELQAELKKKTQALEMMNAMHRVEGKKTCFLPLFFFLTKKKKWGMRRDTRNAGSAPLPLLRKRLAWFLTSANLLDPSSRGFSSSWELGTSPLLPMEVLLLLLQPSPDSWPLVLRNPQQRSKSSRRLKWMWMRRTRMPSTRSRLRLPDLAATSRRATFPCRFARGFL